MKQEGLRERVELLEAGEKLGYPRLGYGRSTKIPHDRRIPQGQPNWEAFCAHAHIRRILPALRIARVLRDNNVLPYHPMSGKEAMPESLPMKVIASEGPVRGVVPEVADLLGDAPDLPPLPLVAVEPARRVKKGGHKRPPHPNSRRLSRG